MAYGISAGYWASGILSILTYESFQNFLFLHAMLGMEGSLQVQHNSHAPWATKLTG